jgi:hypothetical protein
MKNVLLSYLLGSRDSAVGLHDRGVGVRVPVGSRIFSSPHRPYRFRGQPTGALSLGLKRPRRESDHSIHPLPHMPSWRSA